MAPTDGFSKITKTVTWELRRAWSSPKCAITKKVIWPWHTAWRRRIDTGLNYKAFVSDDIWVTEEQYLILKLTGNEDNV